MNAKEMDPTKIFPEPLDALSYSWCPTMDLIAVTVGQGKRVLVFRMNGTKVWDIPVKLGIAKHLVWRPDGRQLAILTTKAQTLIYDTNTARLLSTLQHQQQHQQPNFGHWIGSDTPTQENKLYGILQEQDITKSMPKLPPLPSTSNNSKEHTFTTRQAIDEMIQQEKHGMMDLLFLFGEKDVAITLHGLLLLGSVDVINDSDGDEEIVNSATRTVEDHYLLTSSFTTMQHTLRRFTTHFVSNFDFLQDITLSSSKIIALLGYIEEILTFSTQAIRAYTEFNTKFVGILKDELNNKNEIVVDELYNTLLTGMMNDEVKDWIQNTVGDRGVKRWTKIGETAFDNTRRTILYHLVPSCERLILLLNNLDALTKSANVLKVEQFELEYIDKSIESVQKMLKLLFESVLKINREQELFQSFIIWIQSTLYELQDEAPRDSFVTSEVSSFINSHLERSSLAMIVPYLRRNFNEIKIHTHDIFTSIKEQIRSSITIDQDFQLTLGRITEKQEIKFLDNDEGDALYIVSYHDDTVELFKVDVINKSKQSAIIKFDHEVNDLQLTSDGKLYLVSNGQVLKFSCMTLFIDGVEFNEISQAELAVSPMSDESIGNMKDTKYLTVNAARNIGCAISDDLTKYSVFFLSDEPL